MDGHNILILTAPSAWGQKSKDDLSHAEEFKRFCVLSFLKKKRVCCVL